MFVPGSLQLCRGCRLVPKAETLQQHLHCTTARLIAQKTGLIRVQCALLLGAVLVSAAKNTDKKEYTVNRHTSPFRSSSIFWQGFMSVRRMFYRLSLVSLFYSYTYIASERLRFILFISN